MDIIAFPLITMTTCLTTLPPPGSICNCTTIPPFLDFTFPVEKMTTPESSTGASTTVTVRRQPSSSAGITLTPDGGTALPNTTSTGIPLSNTTGAGTPFTNTTSTPESNFTAMTTQAMGTHNPNGSVTSLPVKDMTSFATHDPDLTTVDQDLISGSDPGLISDPLLPGMTTPDDNITGLPPGSRSDPEDDAIWPIIVAACFGVFVVTCIILFVFWWLKKNGIIMAKCKVHPDSSDVFSDEEKVGDMGTEVTAMDGAHQPPPSPPPTVVVAGGVAFGTGGGNQPVKKLYKKGSVELKPIGNTSLPPIHNTITEDPLTPPETDHPGAETTKPKKKKKKKKKKLSTSNSDDPLNEPTNEDGPNG